MAQKADKLWARVQAIEALKTLSITVPEEIEVADIAWHFGAIVREGPLRGAEARLVFQLGANFATIRVNNGIPEEGRRRFAIAHELGHWILHRNQSQLHLFMVGDLGFSYANSPIEIEANTFASELLMPESMFKRRCDDCLPSFDILSRLAQEFRTTLTATAIRFVDLCSEHCAVVFSKSGKIIRWHRGEHPNFWIESGASLSQHTYASDACSGKSVPTSMKPVPASEWFPTSEFFADRTVMETSVLLGRYGTVLTFLWLPEEETL